MQIPSAAHVVSDVRYGSSRPATEGGGVDILIIE